MCAPSKRTELAKAQRGGHAVALTLRASKSSAMMVICGWRF